MATHSFNKHLLGTSYGPDSVPAPQIQTESARYCLQIPQPPNVYTLTGQTDFQTAFQIAFRSIEKITIDKLILGFPSGSAVRIHLQCRRRRFDPQVGKIPQRRKWQPTPVVSPGEPHGQRSLAGYSPWGHKESDVTEGTEYAYTQGYFTKTE